MSYGPQLPPHLQKKRETSSSDEEEEKSEASIGPKLPEGLCRGPKPPSEETSESYGPQLPPGLTQRVDEAPPDEEDDDDVIGPVLPGQAGNDRASRQLEARAQKMRHQLDTEVTSSKPQKRESWMLELPPEKAKSFGLGPRAFSQSTATKAVRDDSWTDTPEEKARKAALGGEPSTSQEEDPDVIAYMASLKRDQAMDKASKDLKAKRGSESLYDLHQEKVKKHKSSSSSAPAVRKPFDRETDLQVNRFDEAAKQAMLKRARKMDDRFVSGQQKYL